MVFVTRTPGAAKKPHFVEFKKQSTGIRGSKGEVLVLGGVKVKYLGDQKVKSLK
jgi:hypothetical protein